MDKAVVDAEITEVSVEDVVESPEDDESTDVDTAAAETKAVAVDHEIDLTEADKLLKQHNREVELRQMGDILQLACSCPNTWCHA